MLRSPRSFHVKSLSTPLTAIALCCASHVSLAQTSNNQLETIEVTAQKRTQNLQEVPIAVTALSGRDLEETVSFDLYDLQGYVPAFQAFQSQSATNSGFSIRGIGTSTQNFGFESSVGLYVDGVYRPRQNSVINDLVDVEAVEVLRGPQGTLFGKNTPSGAVVMRTKAPSFENGDGFVRVTVGNYNLLNLAAASSFNAIDNVLALRFSGFTSNRDGWVDDVYLGDNTLNNRDRSGFRAQALYTPTDNLSVRVIADYAELNEHCCAALTWQDNREANEIEGKYGTDALLMSPLLNATLFTRDDFYDFKTALSQLPTSKMEDRGLSAEVNWQLTHDWSLVSISALRAFDSYDEIDSDFTNANLLTTINDAEQRSTSQELRLHYDGDNVRAIFGGFYFHQALDLNFTMRIGDTFPTFFAASAAEIQPLVDGINQLSNATGGLIAPAATATPANTDFFHSADQSQNSYALFAQSDWELAENMTLTTGIRYTWEDKTLTGRYTEQGPGINGMSSDRSQWPNPTAAATALYNAAAALGNGQLPSNSDLAALAPFQSAGWGFYFLDTSSIRPRPDLDEKLEDEQITGTVKLSYQPSATQLWYASWGTGFKSGGINTDRISPELDPVFDAETTESIEVGMKQEWQAYNLRLNVAGHYTTLDDYQATTFTGSGFNLQNAGSINTKGVEVELTWYPFADTLVHASFMRNLAYFDKFEKGTCWVAYTWHTGVQDPGQADGAAYCSRSGDRLGFEPQTTFALNLQQTIELFGSQHVLSADYQYTGDILLDDSNDPYKKADSFSLLNVRWQWMLEEYDADITFWARNALNEEYVAKNGFDVPVQKGKIMAYPGMPRTYGITLNKRF